MPRISVPELPSRVSPLLTEQQAADLIGLKVATLRRWRWQGRALEFVKIGAAVRYELKVLEAFVAAGRRTSTSDRGERV
jgi:hypothetical protein